jgi:hypothetical protein
MVAQNSELEGFVRSCAQHCTSRLELWERVIGILEPRKVLELGVWRGDFAAHLLAKCASIEEYYMIDPWRKLSSWNKPLNVDDIIFEQAFSAAIDATRFATDKLTVLRGTTLEVINRIPDASLDFTYIDGDHTLRGISIDLINVYPKLKVGGYLAGDDFISDIWQHDTKFEPTLVFPFTAYFAEAVGGCLFALPFHQYLLQKPMQGEAGFRFVDLVGDYDERSLRDQLSLQKLAGKRLRRAIPKPVRSALRRLLRSPERQARC